MASRHALLLVALLVGAAGGFAGCIAQADPARSVPLENVAPLPAPMRAERVVVVGYELSRIDVTTRFGGSWDARAEQALLDMGYGPLHGAGALAFAQPDGPTLEVTPEADGFWLNATFDGFDVFASSIPEAQALAEAAWSAEEPEFLGTVAILEQRAGCPIESLPMRTNAFAARLADRP